MISYVLVMILSVSTGQPVHASLEGPMSRSWCEQLIHQRYSEVHGTGLRKSSCLSGITAHRILLDSFCTRHPGPSPHWPAIEFDCGASAAERPRVAPPGATPGEGYPSSAPEPDRGEPPGAIPTTGNVQSFADPAPYVSAQSDLPGGVGERLPAAAPAPGWNDGDRSPSAAGPAAGAGTAEPEPNGAGALRGAAPASPGQERRFHLGAAASALVARADAQASGHHYTIAAATLERALRIEPENPLLWIALGELRMREGEPAQADGLYRKALELAGGDGQMQARAWRLLAESLRVRGRNVEAADAERQAASAQAQ